MNVIELERWKPSETDPRRLEYAGQPTAAEVFQELKHRLESMGYLPDEYFLMDTEWENGRKIPKDADIFCTTDYGGSEGVYLDVYLKWYDEEQKKSITKSFITGKTLGENGNDLDRMFLISSAITKAFHGDHVYEDWWRGGGRWRLSHSSEPAGAEGHHRGAGGTAGAAGAGHVSDRAAPAADDGEHHRVCQYGGDAPLADEWL